MKVEHIKKKPYILWLNYAWMLPAVIAPFFHRSFYGNQSS